MVRRWLVVASAMALVIATVAAGTSRKPGSTYSRDEVVISFERQGYALAEPADEPGWTAYAPLEDTDGVLLFPRPVRSAPFYVFVARYDATARQFFRQLTSLGPSPDAFDLIRGNVLVGSDSSFTKDGLSADQKQRIRAAMDSLPNSYARS